MNDRRISELSDDVYAYMFDVLDNEPEIDGMEAVRIANRVQKAFLAIVDGRQDELLKAATRAQSALKTFRQSGRCVASNVEYALELAIINAE